MGCSPPGSSAHGVLQGRILEWVAISFSTQANDEEEQVDNTTQDDQDQPEPEPEPEQPQETPEVPDIKVVDDTVKTTGTIKAEVEGQNKPDDMPKTQFKDYDEEGANEVPFIKVEPGRLQFMGSLGVGHD